MHCHWHRIHLFPKSEEGEKSGNGFADKEVGDESVSKSRNEVVPGSNSNGEGLRSSKKNREVVMIRPQMTLLFLKLYTFDKTNLVYR